MASAQKTVNGTMGSSFTIKNLLNLPDDEAEGFGGLRVDQVTNMAPQFALQLHDQRPVNCKPCALCPYNQMILACPLPPSDVLHTEYPRQAAFMGKGAKSPSSKLTHQRRPIRKIKQRPLFSTNQVQTMEREFDSEKYLTDGKRVKLAVELKLTETQVKTWFQNRRTKWRKELRNENPPREVPDGRWKHSIFARQFKIAI